uniref:Uncharacterized protein n=1 Tax=Arundo donax TaxID=35708 RepID=A0A0A8ZGL6_ARUDO
MERYSCIVIYLALLIPKQYRSMTGRGDIIHQRHTTTDK